MSYVGGTVLANQFISKYTFSGHLLDLYSDEWISKNKGLDGMSTSDFKQYDGRYGKDYRNHMLLISCDWYESPTSNFSQDLVNVFPKYKDQLRDYSEQVYYDPSFILINLATQQMAAVGLGRNNQFFMTDVLTNADIPLSLPNDLSAQAILGNGDISYLSSFLKLDHAGILYQFLVSIAEMGELVYSRDCDCTEWLYEELSCAEVGEDGMYEVDGETYSPEDVNEMMATHEQYNKKIKVHEDFLMRLFPNLDLGSLNDY